MKEFHQLAPFWFNKLQADIDNGLEVYVVMNQRLDMREWKCCIVGEAWGWKDDYTEPLSACSTCKEVAGAFFHSLIKKRLGRTQAEKQEGEQDFYKVRNYFVLHWNETHLKQNEEG